MRWCPGCGDYGILTAIQLLLPELGVKPEDLVFVSGIGCAARLPYYMNTYGVHGIHGRAPAIATGVALARPDLHVWVIGGDGDMLSIGGNHLIHALRRNVNLKILMFNNQIYGLTKGQYSPTSEVGKITKSTPFGSLDHPFNPISVAIGAEASFVARTHDMDRKHMMEMFRRAHEHKGAAFVEVYQNCNVFNDGAFDTILNKDARPDMLIDLKHGEPVRFGAEQEFGVVMNEFGEAQDRATSPTSASTGSSCTTSTAPIRRSRSRCRVSPSTPTRRRRWACSARSSAPTYEGAMQQQLVDASAKSGPGDLARASSLGAHLDGHLAAATAPTSVERSEHHAGARLGREERRLLRHAHAGRPRRRGSRATDTGEHRIAALATPLSTRAATACASWRYCHVASGSRGTTSALDDARCRLPRRRGCSAASVRGARLGAGIASASPCPSTSPRPCSVAHRGLERVDAVGARPRPPARISNASASRARMSTPAGRSIKRWIGSMHSSSSTSSTTNVMIASAPPTGRAAP